MNCFQRAYFAIWRFIWRGYLLGLYLYLVDGPVPSFTKIFCFVSCCGRCAFIRKVGMTCCSAAVGPTSDSALPIRAKLFGGPKRADGDNISCQRTIRSPFERSSMGAPRIYGCVTRTLYKREKGGRRLSELKILQERKAALRRRQSGRRGRRRRGREGKERRG